MVDINSISSNLLLVGLVIVGLCCLYLLYSNFVKSKEITELKQKVEDIKTIFLNQQRHNDEEYGKMIHMLSGGGMGSGGFAPSTIQSLTKQNLETHTNSSASSTTGTPTKLININPLLNNAEMMNYGINNNEVYGQNGDENGYTDNKEITLDLHELDNMKVPNDDREDSGDNIENLDNIDILDKLDLDDGLDAEIKNEDDIDNDEEQSVEDNIFDTIHSYKNNSIEIEMLDDNASISTDPMITDKELNDLMNDNQELDSLLNDDAPAAADEGCDENDFINELDLDNLDELDLDVENTKTINIDNDATLTSIIDNTIQNPSIDLSNDTKTISLDEQTSETIELDKLLSGEIKKIEIETKTNNSSNQDLNNMSIKQLKELAKSHKLKTTGSKQELINLLKTVVA